MALITPAQLKIAMMAVKPQPKAKGGPPARKVFGRKPVLRGSFKTAAAGLTLPPADEHPDEPSQYTQDNANSILQSQQHNNPANWIQSTFGEGGGGQPPAGPPAGHAAGDAAKMHGDLQMPAKPPAPSPQPLTSQPMPPAAPTPPSVGPVNPFDPREDEISPSARAAKLQMPLRPPATPTRDASSIQQPNYPTPTPAQPETPPADPSEYAQWVAQKNQASTAAEQSQANSLTGRASRFIGNMFRQPPGPYDMARPARNGEALQGEPGKMHQSAQMYPGTDPATEGFLRGQGDTMPNPEAPSAPTGTPTPHDPNWGQVPEDTITEGGDYPGLDRDQANFFRSQGQQPEPQAPPVHAPEGMPETSGMPQGEPDPEITPPGRFQHVIDDTQRMLGGTRARLQEAEASGNTRLANQLRRHVSSAESRIQDLQRRQTFGQGDYANHLRTEGINNPEAEAAKLFRPGGQMDWYQSASNNAASGGPTGPTGRSPRGNELAAELEASRKMMGSAPEGKTEMAAGPAPETQDQRVSRLAQQMPTLFRHNPASPLYGEGLAREYPNLAKYERLAGQHGEQAVVNASRARDAGAVAQETPMTTMKESAASFVDGLFGKEANMYGRTDSTIPIINQPKVRTTQRERYKQRLKLPLPNEPEKAAGAGCRIKAMMSRKKKRRKKADAEDPLFARMMSKGKMGKGKAVAIAKSRGWIRQSGRHLEPTAKGRTPIRHAREDIAKEAAFIDRLFAKQADGLMPALQATQPPPMVPPPLPPSPQINPIARVPGAGEPGGLSLGAGAPKLRGQLAATQGAAARATSAASSMGAPKAPGGGLSGGGRSAARPAGGAPGM